MACDEQGLGLEIVHVGFTSFHPPVGIATAYEGVVSAQIERRTLATRAQGLRESALPAAAARAERAMREAEGHGARRLAEATGAVARFRAAQVAAEAAPELFRFRRQMEAVEEALADRSLYVVDHRLAPGSGEPWIDFRPATPTP
jgi:regulator of protease activity HflC (stomatin/prohibitin superfamily)